MKTIMWLVAAVLMLGTAAQALGQSPKDELTEQFRARQADLRMLKQKGAIGETVDGYIDLVDKKAADERASRLVADENRDRRKLYQILADEINKENPGQSVKATVETVAVRNAQRNIEKAGPDEFLRVAKDSWIRVKDFPRYVKVATSKAQGKAGETAAGLVEIVNPADKGDAGLTRLVEEENARRTAEYKALAAKEGVEQAVIGKRMGKRNFENAKVGEMLKEEGGSWRKK